MFIRLKKLLSWKGSLRPEFNLNEELYGKLKPFRLPLVLTIIIILFGTFGYMIIDDFPILDAIYQTGITFTTVGFGEVNEISNKGRIFTIVLIITGFALFSMSIGILINEINKGDILRILKERDMLYKIVRLTDHFVICHHNEYTIELSKELRREHIPFVVVDNAENLEEIAKKYKYPYYIKDHPYKERAMLKAHLSSARGLVALSSSISDNIALIASARLFEKDRKIPRPYHIISSAYSFVDVERLKRLGANSVVSPAELTGKRISSMVSRPDMDNLLGEFLHKSEGSLDIEEVLIPKNSWLVFKTLKETRLRDITNVSVIGIKKASGKFFPMPNSDTLIINDDTFFLLGTFTGIKKTKNLIKQSQKPKELKYV